MGERTPMGARVILEAGNFLTSAGLGLDYAALPFGRSSS